MATIYRGRDMRMDRAVAIKVLREVYSTDPKFVTRFQREAKAASSLQHPNIVQVYDYGQSDGNYFIVMEMVEGADLRRYLRSRGVLAMDRAVIIAHDVALGLGAAHRRSIVHRDVKPQNIMVGRDGSIKLTDFGIASVYKDINAERLTTTGMTLGTVQYYAPEQAQGEIVSPAADVYALGIVMYEMVTGRTPFDGDTPVAVAMQHIQDVPMPPSQLNPNVPPALEEIILRCLEKIPEMRFRDGNMLARALELLGEEDKDTVQAANMLPGNGSGPHPGVGALVGPAAAGYLNGAARPGAQISSPNQQMSPSAMGSNGVVENGAATVLQADQGYASSAVDPNDATTAMEPPRPVPMSTMGDMGSGSTRPIQRDALGGRPAGVVREQRDTRMAGIVTVLILAATVLLLAFSIYLASQLHFLPFPSGNSNSGTSTAVQAVQVPDLKNLNFQEATQQAKSKGFKLIAKGGATTGKVTKQSPEAGAYARPGTTIQVELSGAIAVPSDLIGKSLDEAKTELNNLGIQFVPQQDDRDPHDPNRDANIITRTDPKAGQTLKDGEVLTLYVTNWTDAPPSTAPTQAPPAQQPTQAPPAQQPTQAPQPTPTTAPQPTPTTAPQPTPTTAPVPTPTTAPVPTPTVTGALPNPNVSSTPSTSGTP
ncbi:protein kinase [Dictyobacter aurantiacus]|uniref:non-specific serine/threonine protein kinase n=2 Tax=Dictyobacter aurantiacus TaxID=1936993 RepID=A0A401ZBX6_9CHLR|nr:protein kinase [Dictyobacter aurantiacus]